LMALISKKKMLSRDSNPSHRVDSSLLYVLVVCLFHLNHSRLLLSLDGFLSRNCCSLMISTSLTNNDTADLNLHLFFNYFHLNLVLLWTCYTRKDQAVEGVDVMSGSGCSRPSCKRQAGGV